jgi:predicted nuclease with TOPRIM domain
MKTFKQYISENRADTEKLLKALLKQKEKLEKHATTNFNVNSRKFYDLVDKYDELSDKVKDIDNMVLWKKYCKMFNLSPQHDSRDFYA